MAHPRHAQVRARYRNRCGYCGVSEEDTGGELCVDHYVPITVGGSDDDDNLVYACFRCNQFKSDFSPTDEDLAVGRSVLHPLLHAPADHVLLDEPTGRLEAITETGRFHITLLHLNRPALVAYRLRQRYLQLLAERRNLLEAENRELRAILLAQEKYIARLKNLIKDQPDIP